MKPIILNHLHQVLNTLLLTGIKWPRSGVMATGATMVTTCKIDAGAKSRSIGRSAGGNIYYAQCHYESTLLARFNRRFTILNYFNFSDFIGRMKNPQIPSEKQVQYSGLFMHDSVVEFGNLTAIPTIGSTYQITRDTLENIDIMRVANRTFGQTFSCILISAIHAAVAIVVY